MVNQPRPRGILTDVDRDFLELSEDERKEEYKDHARFKRRREIRKRLYNAILDVPIIVAGMPLTDLDEALSDPEGDGSDPPPVANHITALPALLYLYHRKQEPRGMGPDGWRTAIDVMDGIKQALSRMGIAYESVSVDIEVDRGPELGTLADKDLDELSKDQLTQLHRAGLIDSDTFADAWTEKS